LSGTGRRIAGCRLRLVDHGLSPFEHGQGPQKNLEIESDFGEPRFACLMWSLLAQTPPWYCFS
jgi:hypothetical protein